MHLCVVLLDILEYADTEANEMRSLHVLVVNFMFEEILGSEIVEQGQNEQKGQDQTEFLARKISCAAAAASLVEKLWNLTLEMKDCPSRTEGFVPPESREEAVHKVSEAMSIRADSDFISIVDFSAAVAALSLPKIFYEVPMRQKLQDFVNFCFKELDKDQSGQIDYEEFQSWMNANPQHSHWIQK